MIDTLTTKCKAGVLSSKILAAKTSLRRAIEEQCNTKYRSTYYQSTENVLRSLNVYYSHHVKGKRKYINVRKANKAPGIPNFVTYKVLGSQVCFVLIIGKASFMLSQPSVATPRIKFSTG